MKFRFALSLLLLSLCASCILAQSTYGTFVGTVQDQSGSVIPGAAVTATNLDTATARTATSNNSGQFKSVNMQPGQYSISAEKSGFAPVKVDGVTLDARQERRVDLTLGLASIKQNVVVEAAAAAINTQNANISNTMGNTRVTQLPANYRSLDELR